MRTNVLKLGRATIIYGICNACTAGAPLLLLPIYTTWLSPNEFGSLSLFSTLLALATPLVSIGASAAVQRRYFDLDENEFSCYVRTSLVVVFVLGAGLFGVSIALAFLKKIFFGIPSGWVCVAVVVAVAIAIQQLVLAIWQAEQRLSEYVKFQLLYLLLLIGFPVSLVMVLKLGLHGAIVGVTIANGFSGVFLFWTLFKDGRLSGGIHKAYLFHLFRFGCPLLPHLLAGWAIAMLDRFLIARHWGLVAVGIYAFAFQIAQVLNLLSGAFNQAFTPWLYQALVRGDKSDRISIDRIVIFYSIVIVFAGGFVLLMMQFIVPQFAPRYVSALEVAPWVLLGFTFNALYRIASTFQMFAERTFEIAAGTVLSSVVSVVLNVLLIEKYGIVAAGWSSSIGFGLLFLWSAFRAVSIRRNAFGL